MSAGEPVFQVTVALVESARVLINDIPETGGGGPGGGGVGVGLGVGLGLGVGVGLGLGLGVGVGPGGGVVTATVLPVAQPARVRMSEDKTINRTAFKQL